MSESIEVSVLIPVLNEEAELEQAARAMLAQELDGLAEFIFIDGGSVNSSSGSSLIWPPPIRGSGYWPIPPSGRHRR